MPKDDSDVRPSLIVIDPGHGGTDPGAVNEKMKAQEKDVNLALALIIKEIVETGDFLYRVALTRSNDSFVSLEDRCRIANEIRAHAFVSLHCNAAENKSARGYEVWTSKGQTQGDILATELGIALGVAMPYSEGRLDYDDGDLDKEANFYVLRHTKMPAALVEVEFISNDDCAVFLKNEANLRQIAVEMTDSIEVYLES